MRGLFRNPSAYEYRPGAFFWNQTGHIIGAGVLPASALALWAALAGFPLWWGLAVQLAIYAAWEWGQYRIHSADAWDCVEDWAYVACGALAVLWPVTAAVGAVFLLSGWLRRRG